LGIEESRDIQHEIGERQGEEGILEEIETSLGYTDLSTKNKILATGS